MQLRVPFPNRANALLRNPTSCVNSSCCMRSMLLGIRIRHGRRFIHNMAEKGAYDLWSIRPCKRHWCIISTLNSKYITNGRTCSQGMSLIRRLSVKSMQSANTASMLGADHEPSVKPEAENPETGQPDMQVGKKIMKVKYFTSKQRVAGSIRWLSISSPKFLSPSRQNLIMSPLTAWLISKTRPERAEICEIQARKHMNRSRDLSVSTILLFHLEMRETMALGKRSLLNSLVMSALPSLTKKGFTAEDLHIWGDILTATSDKEAVHRYTFCQSVKPTFILLEILRRSRLDVKPFCSLLVQSYHLSRTRAVPQLKNSTPGNVPVNNLMRLPPSESILEQDITPLSISEFEVLVCRLLHHARQVWPATMTTISEMVVSYCQRLVDDRIDTFGQIYSRVCKIHNLLLHRLSLPASVNPMRSMVYNWQAQRIILASAAAFQPPLQLSRTSYRAVAQVLLASGKSSTELRYASLLQRTWPPWRKELDGMDVKRSPDMDISRAVAVLSRMKEAGYAHDAVDRAIKVLGGREPDGTPTIQTRRLVKVRRSPLRISQSIVDEIPDDCTVEWAARITATRDVHEAWDAFQGFTRDRQQPSHAMYYAMFEKLIYRTMTNIERQDRAPVAGDAREALPVMDDNISASEKLRMQPPTMESLFSRMIADGLRPSGRFLEMLVANARSLENLALYMKHGAIGYNKFIEILRNPGSIRAPVLNSIPNMIFDAFIRFLCRPRNQLISDPSEFLEQEESIVRFKQHSDPIAHAFELVKIRQPASRNAWYTIIRAVARSGFIFDPSLNQHMNDVLSWQFVEAIIRSGMKAGFNLDTHGFGRVCIGLEKAIRAKDYVPEKIASLVQKGPELIKDTFAMLSESVEAGVDESMEDEVALPKLLFDFPGYQLHRYIRVLCLTNDIDEATSVLKWIVKHKEELEVFSLQLRNGPVSLRRTLVAVRALLGWTGADEKVVERLRVVMEQLDGSWGGWPTNEEVESYLSYKPQDNSGDQQGTPEEST